jgi:hypothetical protein
MPLSRPEYKDAGLHHFNISHQSIMNTQSASEDRTCQQELCSRPSDTDSTAHTRQSLIRLWPDHITMPQNEFTLPVSPSRAHTSRPHRYRPAPADSQAPSYHKERQPSCSKGRPVGPQRRRLPSRASVLAIPKGVSVSVHQVREASLCVSVLITGVNICYSYVVVSWALTSHNRLTSSWNTFPF